MKELLDIYRKAKREHEDCIIIVRDYNKNLYYIFENDAQIAHDVAGTYLFMVTDHNIKATYFKFYELDTYLPKLVRAGKRVAICG